MKQAISVSRHIGDVYVLYDGNKYQLENITPKQEYLLVIYLGNRGNLAKLIKDAKSNVTGENKQGRIVKISPNGKLLDSNIIK